MCAFNPKNLDVLAALPEEARETAFHCYGQCLFPNREYPAEYFNSFLSDTGRHAVRDLAEYVCWAINEHLLGKSVNFEQFRLPEVTDPTPRGVDLALIVLRQIQQLFYSVAKNHHDEVLAASNYFDSDEPAARLWGAASARPDLDCWRRHVPHEDFEKIQRCVQADGLWRKDLMGLFSVMNVTMKQLPRLLPLAAVAGKPSAMVMQAIRSLGVYLPPSADTSALQRRLQALGMPESLRIGGGGKVLLCLEECRRLTDTLGAEHPTTDPVAIEASVITDILVHEHTHGILREGIDPGPGDGPADSMSRDNAEAAVDEALAEWAELEYFRDDPFMTEVVLTHARAGAYPGWPYAGALVIERLGSTLGLHQEAFRVAARALRRGSAAKLFDQWRRRA